MRPTGVGIVVAVLGTATLVAAPAWGYVREVTQEGAPIAWKNPCVAFDIYLGSPPPVLGADDFLVAATAAAAAWSYPQIPGTDLRFTAVPQPGATTGIGYDHRSVVVFRTRTWCRDPVPVDDAGVEQPECYPPSALAVTSLFKNRHTGEILDADIEFNAVDFTWGDWEGKAGLSTSTTADFQNALTHELGHVAGLDHNCFSPSDGQPRLYDHTGALEVDCYNNPTLPSAIAEATMYPSVVLADTSRRSLSLDDVQGVCDIYPHAHDVCPTASDGGGGCTVAPASTGSGRGWAWAALAALAALGLGWKIRRRRAGRARAS